MRKNSVLPLLLSLISQISFAANKNSGSAAPPCGAGGQMIDYKIENFVGLDNVKFVDIRNAKMGDKFLYLKADEIKGRKIVCFSSPKAINMGKQTEVCAIPRLKTGINNGSERTVVSWDLHKVEAMPDQATGTVVLNQNHVEVTPGKTMVHHFNSSGLTVKAVGSDQTGQNRGILPVLQVTGSHGDQIRVTIDSKSSDITINKSPQDPTAVHFHFQSSGDKFSDKINPYDSREKANVAPTAKKGDGLVEKYTCISSDPIRDLVGKPSGAARGSDAARK